jgi:uncharacterized protein with PIN domain
MFFGGVAMSIRWAEFRFYEELNDFLDPARRKRSFWWRFKGRPTVKDVVEALGVPHTEIDLVLANGVSVGFQYPLVHGDRIAVYPVFESLDISALIRLRPKPLRQIRFILDVHLGKLTRLMRLMGMDSCYRNDFSDDEIIAIAKADRRIILTRDRDILKHGSVTHGYWIRQTEPQGQILEVIRRFDLKDQVRLFSRCMACNTLLEAVAKERVIQLLQPWTAKYYTQFWQCPGCQRIYWKGSHFEHLLQRSHAILELAKGLRLDKSGALPSPPSGV